MLPPGAKSIALYECICYLFCVYVRLYICAFLCVSACVTTFIRINHLPWGATGTGVFTQQARQEEDNAHPHGGEHHSVDGPVALLRLVHWIRVRDEHSGRLHPEILRHDVMLLQRELRERS